MLVSEKVIVIKKPNLEIQKLIEKHQINPPKQSVYEEDQDYSDENVEDSYYLDPTQMDQSLLEGFGPPPSKSEEQLLQEAILLQEQFNNPLRTNAVSAKQTEFNKKNFQKVAVLWGNGRSGANQCSLENLQTNFLF